MHGKQIMENWPNEKNPRDSIWVLKAESTENMASGIIYIETHIYVSFPLIKNSTKCNYNKNITLADVFFKNIKMVA